MTRYWLCRPKLHGPVCGARKEGMGDEWIAPHFINRPRMSIVGLQIIVIIRCGAFVDEAILCAYEVCRGIMSGEVDTEATALAEHDAFLVAIHGVGSQVRILQPLQLH